MTNRAVFNELMGIAGWQGEFDDEVKIIGSDPVLLSPFRIGEMAAGVHAAIGATVSKLWELQTGRRQQVTVNVTAAAASLRSVNYMHRLDLPPEAQDTQMQRGQLFMMDFFQTRDKRWIFIHAGRDHFHNAALEILKCAETPAAVANAVAQWDAGPLEDAFAAGGGMAVVARTSQEWNEHPQGSILKKLPAVEVIKIGDGPPMPLPGGDRPLAGVRVIDLTHVLSGPTCGRTLAEHGADVLRVDAPNDARMKVLNFIIDTAHGKRATFLDLKQEGDYQKMLALIAKADVFSENFRFGKLAKLGLSAEALAKMRPGIICTSMNCYGYEGPWRERPGMEQLGQASAGLSLEQGGFKRPMLLPGAITDYTTGYLAAFGTLVALYRRAREGGSYRVRTSLTQSAMMLGRAPRVTLSPEELKQLETPGEEPSHGVILRDYGLRLKRREISMEEIERISETVDTPYGKIRRLAPIVKLSETPARWTLPPVPAGTHPPEWL